ncbi:Uncharacterised protein g270 [Pycnogonum litorale]
MVCTTKMCFAGGCSKLDIDSFNISCNCDASYIKCENVSLTQIKSKFSGKFKRTQSLKVTAKIKHIPSRAFDGVNIRALTILNSKVETIDSDAFSGLSDLFSIEFKNSMLTKPLDPAFSSLTNLRSLNIIKNGNYFSPITITKTDTDKLSAKLYYLILTECNIVKIEPEALTRFKILRHVTLSGNHLTKLEGNTFPATFKLDLTSNQLLEVPLKALKPTSQRVNRLSVTLDRNLISKMPTELDVKKLMKWHVFLNMYNNPINCTSDMKWILKHNRKVNWKRYSNLRGDCAKVNDGTGKRIELFYLKESDFRTPHINLLYFYLYHFIY